MRNLSKIIILLFFISFEQNAQIIINEDFETGTINPMISFQSVGGFSTAPGVKNNTSISGNNVFGFGKSVCGSSCFDSYKTTLVITFNSPTFVTSIAWKEMEIGGNWGSQGQLFLDNIAFGGSTLGALPVNSQIPDASPRIQNYTINQTITTIKFVVNDITSASEIIIDELQISGTLPNKKIAAYEYWFDDNYANKITTSNVNLEQINIATNLNTTLLSNGIHNLNFRFQDEDGKWSATLSDFFYKIPNNTSVSTPKIVELEYWFDDDYANKITTNTSQTLQIIITENLTTTSLSNGIHTSNFRFKDETGKWSSVLSEFFYKTPNSTVVLKDIVAYEYWFNDDYASVTNSPIGPNQLEVLNTFVVPENSGLGIGNHHFNIRFKDSEGKWSSIVSDPFQIITLETVDFKTLKSLVLYPNPTNGELNFEFGKNYNSIVIGAYDVNGKKVFETKEQNTLNTKIELNLPSGFYLITIEVDAEIATRKIIIR